MTSTYEIKTDSGKVIMMSGDSPEHAMRRVADLYACQVVAWRWPSTFVGPVHHSQIIG